MAEPIEINSPIVEPERSDTAPTRSGACPFCLRKHLLKARGYAHEIGEDATREWEADGLLENLLLAEDHAVALADPDFAKDIRLVRIAVEGGGDAAHLVSTLYERFRIRYAERLSSGETKPKQEDF